MDIIEELRTIRDAPAYGNASFATLFWKLVAVVQEMAKRIEALEERLHAKERARGYIHFPDQG